MIIRLLRVDVSSVKLDALVAPSDPQTQVPAGRAIVTQGGNLLARFVIQVPMPRVDEPAAEERLRASTLAALQYADDLAVGTIGMPPIPRENGFPMEHAARIMIRAAIDYRARARSLQNATFCLFGEEEHEAFARVLKELEA
jgi:O-acetyl-ADP-ribose deacetylase (regulator of RNase III)